MLIEDDVRQRFMTGWLLRSGGYEVRDVGSAEAALLALDEPVDLVITDVDLGDTGPDGLALATYARSRFACLPILVISAGVPDRFEQLNLSRASYLQKPFTERALLEAVCSLGIGSSAP